MPTATATDMTHQVTGVLNRGCGGSGKNEEKVWAPYLGGLETAKLVDMSKGVSFDSYMN